VGNWNRFSFCSVTLPSKTTERYLGSRQNLKEAVNDRLGLDAFRTVYARKRHPSVPPENLLRALLIMLLYSESLHPRYACLRNLFLS
jgi:hypothetical protein